MRRFLSRFLIAIVLLAPAVAFGQQPARMALLIGNQNYKPKIGPLKNPINDVRLIEASLVKLGFKVTVVPDADLKTLNVALQRYARQVGEAGPGAISFFFYSGHGIVNRNTGLNYLIPVDLTDADDDRFWDEAMRQSVVIDLLRDQASNATHYVVFDACRNELQISAPTVKALGGSGKGLAAIDKISTGMLIAYSTEPNRTASDEGVGGGPYAKALAEELLTPGVQAIEMFTRVQRRVSLAIKQNPYIGLSPMPAVYFAGEPVTDKAVADRQRAAAAEWVKLEGSRDLVELLAFAQKYFGTIEAQRAIEKIEALEKIRKASPMVAGPAPGSPPAAQQQPSNSSTAQGSGWFKRAMAALSSAFPTPAPPTPPAPAKPPVPQLPPIDAEEGYQWEVAQFLDTKAAYQKFIEKYPASRHLGEAKASIGKVEETKFEEIEPALAKANEVIRSNRAEFRKFNLRIHAAEGRQKIVDACMKDKKYVAILRGFAQSMAVSRLTLAALYDSDLKAGDRSGIYGLDSRSTPRDLLPKIGLQALPAFLTKLRAKLAPNVLGSSDIKAFSQELLRYKQKFDTRISDDKMREIGHYTGISKILGDDKKADISCLDEAVQLRLGTEEASDEDPKPDDAPVYYHAFTPHQYLHSFWYRRRLEGSSELAALVLKRIIAE